MRVRRVSGARRGGARAPQHDDEQPGRFGEGHGAIGVVGVFTPEDPKSPDRLERHGQIAFEMGRFFEKGSRWAPGRRT